MAIKPETLAKPVFIYILIDPNNQDVFYVGQTVMPETRLSGHIIDARNGVYNKPRSGRINSIVKCGMLPVMRIVEETVREYADSREAYWISRYFVLGAPLTNDLVHIPKKFKALMDYADRVTDYGRNDPAEDDEPAQAD